MPSYDSLPPRQLHAARLIALGTDLKTVSREVGLELSTLYKIKCEDYFKQAVHELKLEVHKEFMARVSALAARATERLADMIDQTVEAPITHADQFKAIKMVFDMSAEAVRTETLLREVEQLKELLVQQNSIQGVTIETLNPAPSETSSNDNDQ